MSNKKTLLSIIISGLLTAGGAAVASDCEERAEAFEDRMETVQLTDAQADKLDNYVDTAAELADDGYPALCNQMLVDLNSMLDEYSDANLTASTTARMNDADLDSDVTVDLDNDGKTLEQEIESDYRHVSHELNEAGEEIENAAETAGNAVVTGIALTAEEIDDEDVVNATGEEIAEFEGFVRHNQSGEAHAVLEIEDGWFSERDIVVPISDLSLNAEGELTYNGMLDLDDAVDFVEDDFEIIDDDQRVSAVSRR